MTVFEVAFYFTDAPEIHQVTESHLLKANDADEAVRLTRAYFEGLGQGPLSLVEVIPYAAAAPAWTPWQ